MPKKLDIKEIEAGLPAFVKIIPETYKGARYKARFIDIEYNEEFEAQCGSVISLQHGCASRSNDRRAQAVGYTGCKAKTPIEAIIAQLPPYLELDRTTYKGKRAKAKFYDKEYNVHFEAYVCNVIRDGKGYCPERKSVEFKKSVSIPIEIIEARLFKMYGNEFKLIKETYIDTNHSATFEDSTGKQFKFMVQIVLTGRAFNQDKQREWKALVLERDNYECKICQARHPLRAHHIFSWANFQDQRLDVNNGITLCEKHHREFHSIYGNGNNTLEQFLEFIKQKGEQLSSLAMSLKDRLTSCGS